MGAVLLSFFVSDAGGSAAMLEDTFEHHVALARRAESDELFRLLVESVQDYAILMLSPEGTVMTWNLGAERIKGYRASEIIGEHFSRFYPREAKESGWPQRELEIAVARGRFADGASEKTEVSSGLLSLLPPCADRTMNCAGSPKSHVT